MKVLFVLSGNSGLYPYLEKSIQDTFISLGHSIKTISPKINEETIKLIESFEPNFVLVFVGYKIQMELLHNLKKKGHILGIWFTEDPFYIDKSISLAEEFHYIFTIDLGAYEYYKQIFPAKNIIHLPLGTDPSIYFPPKSNNHYFYDLCLVGYPYPERVKLANYLLEQTSHKLILAGPFWRRFIKSGDSERMTVINKWIEPSLVNLVYHSSKIILNSHRSFKFHKNINTLGIENKSINNRTFDIAASGGFQLLSARPDIGVHFDTKNEIITYSTDEDCKNLINKFLNDGEGQRTDYSNKAKERALNCHTFSHRIQRMINIIEGREEKI
jgi:spore maturation protein CgeB